MAGEIQFRTRAEAQNYADRTGGKVSFQNGQYIVTPSYQNAPWQPQPTAPAAQEYNFNVPWPELGGMAGFTPTSPSIPSWQSALGFGTEAGGVPSGGEVPGGETLAGEDGAVPVGETVYGLQEYSDGTWHDEWGRVVARSPDEAKAYMDSRDAEPPEEMSEYQRAMLGLNQQELDWQMSQGGVSQGTGTTQETYDTWKTKLLSELTGPRDWITRWQVMNMPRGGERKNVRTEQQTLPEMRKAYESRQDWLGWEGKPEDWSHEDKVAKQEAGIKAKLSVRERVKGEPLTMDEKTQAVSDWYEGQLPAIREKKNRRPSAPTAPDWLPEFVPGLTAGQEISQLPIKTPSGQQWGMTPWSVREGLAGYADYAGQRPYRDILEHAAMMAPAQPKGAGTERWRPTRQR